MKIIAAPVTRCLRTARFWLQAGQCRKGHKVDQGYLGHKDIRHAVRYTELSPTRFKNFWPD
jgi:hypothetical protein